MKYAFSLRPHRSKCRAVRHGNRDHRFPHGGYVRDFAKWTVYIVTDTGRIMPHWSDYTRARARAFLKGMGAMPIGVRAYVAKTDTSKGWAF